MRLIRHRITPACALLLALLPIAHAQVPEKPAGETPQGFCPAGALQVQRSDLQFSISHGGIGIGEGSAAEPSAYRGEG